MINGCSDQAVLTVGGTLRMNNWHEQPMIIVSRGLLIYRICDENHALINAGKIILQ